MTGSELIAAERQRQIEVEGWSPEHDDEHTSGELAFAAATYALYGTGEHNPQARADYLWPWDDEWLKITEPTRSLIKAGALIAAEIDRRLRAGETIG